MDFLALRAANTHRHQEWHKGNNLSLSFRGNELAGEVGEACNVIKKIERERMGSVGARATIEDLGEELADVVMCTDLICMDLGIDLGDAVRRKFDKSSHKYGLKTMIDGLYLVWSARLGAFAADAAATSGAEAVAQAHRFTLEDAMALCTDKGSWPVSASVAARMEEQRG